jgi:branched-subunit amino acid transport protein
MQAEWPCTKIQRIPGLMNVTSVGIPKTNVAPLQYSPSLVLTASAVEALFINILHFVPSLARWRVVLWRALSVTLS